MTKPTDIAPDAAAHWIQTYAHGIAAEPFDLKPDQIHLPDIAHALAHQCRYMGHVSRFYSVATHSIAVMNLAMLEGVSKRAQLWALLHDAGEAFIGDVAAPLKRHPIFEGYRKLEAEIDQRLRARFGLAEISEAELNAVRTFDLAMLGPERRALLRKPPREWVKFPEIANADEAFRSATLLTGDPAAWYLYHFHRLSPLVEVGT